MSKIELGSVSHDTMRTDDLVIAFLGVLEVYNNAKYEELVKYYEVDENDIQAWCERVDNAHELLDCLWDELADLAPPYCYFGSTPGDGCDYGFWVDEESIEYAKSSNDLAFGDELPPSQDGLLEFLLVSDHGNMELYSWKEDKWVSEWAV